MKTKEELQTLVETKQILNVELDDQEVLLVNGSDLDPQTSLKFIEKYSNVLSSRQSDVEDLLKYV